MALKVVVAEDSYLVREGVRSLHRRNAAGQAAFGITIESVAVAEVLAHAEAAQPNQRPS